MDSSQRRRVEDRTRGQHRVRVVTALAAVGSGVLATVLSLLLTGTSATASTTTNPTGDSATQQDNQSTQNNQDQLQAPDQAPSQTYLGGGHGSSGGT
jgi:hypothetical protein